MCFYGVITKKLLFGIGNWISVGEIKVCWGWECTGGIILVGGRNEQIFGWCGETFLIPPSTENPVLYKYIYIYTYMSSCGYYCYHCFIISGWKELEILVHNFLSTLLRLLGQVSTMQKHASLLHLFRNWYTESWTLNQPSLCASYTNLLPFRGI